MSEIYTTRKGETIGYAGDTPNGLKEAVERYEYQEHLRKEHLGKKYGSKERGEAAYQAEKR